MTPAITAAAIRGVAALELYLIFLVEFVVKFWLWRIAFGTRKALRVDEGFALGAEVALELLKCNLEGLPDLGVLEGDFDLLADFAVPEGDLELLPDFEVFENDLELVPDFGLLRVVPSASHGVTTPGYAPTEATISSSSNNESVNQRSITVLRAQNLTRVSMTAMSDDLTTGGNEAARQLCQLPVIRECDRAVWTRKRLRASVFGSK